MSDTVDPAAEDILHADQNEADDAQPRKPSRLRAIWEEVKGLLLLLIAVLAFHSFIAKPFYIPSISMMPNLMVGDRLVVSKYPYGWSHVSPTIPNLKSIFNWLVLREQVDSLAYEVPVSENRVWGKMPERGDIVIFTPEGHKQDWIKRVIGLPGDTIAMRDGQVILNGKPVPQEAQPKLLLPLDSHLCENGFSNPTPCHDDFYNYEFRDVKGRTRYRVPIVRETLPNGASYNTIDTRISRADNMAPVTVPDGHVFLMGDNRDHSSDSRVSSDEGGLGGPVAWHRIGGRAEIITFSVDGTTRLNPTSWFSSLRGGRAGTSLRPDKSPVKTKVDAE